MASRPAPEFDPVMISGLPANLEAERMLLGSVMLDAERMHDLRGLMTADDFSIEKHRILWGRMCDLYDRGVPVGRLSLIEELQRKRQIELVDGLSYIGCLDEGMPRFPVLEGYVRSVKDKALMRRLAIAGQTLANRAVAGLDTPQELLERTLQGIIDMTPGGDGDSGWQTAGEIIAEYGGVGSLMSPPQDAAISWPWPTVQRFTCGLHDGQLIVLAARPSIGKTSAALQVAYRAAHQAGVGVFSLEMSRKSLIARMVTQASQVDGMLARANHLSESQRRAHMEAHAHIDPLPLFVEKRKTFSVPGIHAALRQLRTRTHIGLVVIDYLQLVTAVDRNDNRATEIGAMTRGLKLLAGEFGVPVLLLCQLNRANERDERKPKLTDLRDSGRIEEDADVVLFLHDPRPAEHAPVRETELIIAKQREGPRDETVSLGFVRSTQTFTEFSENGDA